MAIHGGEARTPNVLCGGAQLLNGPTQYLTRQRLPMTCVKLFFAVFAVPLLSSRLFSSSLLAFLVPWYLGLPICNHSIKKFTKIFPGETVVLYSIYFIH